MSYAAIQSPLSAHQCAAISLPKLSLPKGIFPFNMHPLRQSPKPGLYYQLSNLLFHHPGDADDGCRGAGIHVHRPWSFAQNIIYARIPAQTQDICRLLRRLPDLRCPGSAVGHLASLISHLPIGKVDQLAVEG